MRTQLGVWIISILFVTAFSATTPAARTNGTLSPAGASSAPGSVVRFEHLKTRDDLSQNAAMAVFQDSRGYLWIGTQNGLDRYDGYAFTIFRHDAEDPASISYNSILAIAEDRNGMLWVGTSGGGLNRYDPATETFTSCRNVPGEPGSLGNDTVTAILQDSGGTLWVGALGGLDRYDPVTGGFDHFRNNPDDVNSLSINAISLIFEDSDGALWIGTGALGVPGAGLNRFSPSDGTAVHFRHDKADPTGLAGDNISAVYEAQSHK